VNVFQNSGPRADGRLVIGPAASEPGDEIRFLALRDVVVVITSCAVDYPPAQRWPLHSAADRGHSGS